MNMRDNFGKIAKQLQKMQEDFQNTQNEIANSSFIGEAGGGLVKVELSGRHYCNKVVLDPSLIKDSSEEDREMLEDLIKAAINQATQKIEDFSTNKTSHLMSGMQLPPGFDLPFGDKK